MDRFENEGPPRWALAFFRWFCRPEMREHIEGDLLEIYHQRRMGIGLAKAKWLLIKDVFQLFRPSIIGKPHIRLQQFNIMKNIKWARLIAVNLLLAFIILSPFFPGPANNIVLAFSVAAQVLGLFGLSLIPPGLAWTIIQVQKIRNPDFTAADQTRHNRISVGVTLLVAFAFMCFALAVPQTMPKVSFIIAMVLVLIGLAASWRYKAEVILAAAATSCLCFMVLILTLAVFVGVGILPGLLVLIFVGSGLTWLFLQVNRLRKNDTAKFRQLPVYLVVMPLISLLVFLFLMKPASNFSRNYAIERTEGLIAAIEDYKIKQGAYPASLQDVAKLYPGKVIEPNIMGIAGFKYEKLKNHYSLAFSQWLDWGSLEEIVLYDKSNMRNNFTEYDLCPMCDYKCAVCRSRTAFASYNTNHPDWQYYHCD